MTPLIPFLARAAAIAIAVLAVLDPAITTARRSDAVIAVIAATAGDEGLAGRVAGTLARSYTVVRAPLPAASATVLVGTRLHRLAADMPAPVFAVLPDPAPLRIVHVAAPARAPAASLVTITAAVRVDGAAGRTLDVLLLDGDVLADRAVIELAPDQGVARVPLAYTPARAGVAALRVRAAVEGGRPADADVVIDVRDGKRAVLFHDARPSWMSTFVRRALEQDERFTITSRTITSRGISTEFGRPPARLDDAGALAAYDVVVIGAPEALAAGEVAGLERWLRSHGGSLLLLPDRRAAGAWERLVDVTRWSTRAGAPVELLPDGILPGPVRATGIVSPARLPPGATTIAAVRDDAADVEGTAAIWSMPAGIGRIVVSGALDAWRFRDPGSSAFEPFFRALIADLAEAAQPAITAALDRDAVGPGERIELEVVLRDAAGGSANASALVHAFLEHGAGADTIRLWPAAAPGTLRGIVAAPPAPGRYRVTVGAGAARAEAAFVVGDDPAASGPDEGGLVAGWAAARGGAAVAADQLPQLGAMLADALRDERQRSPWHPMRSPWWILPFSLALGAEWWWRRRRGLA